MVGVLITVYSGNVVLPTTNKSRYPYSRWHIESGPTKSCISISNLVQGRCGSALYKVPVLAEPQSKQAFTSSVDMRGLSRGYPYKKLVFAGFSPVLTHISLLNAPDLARGRLEAKSSRKTVCGVTIWSAVGKSSRI